MGTALRSADLRRAEVSWGCAIAAEWAHFVALGVFAYRVGGTSAVGIAGLVRLLPAAVTAPFAASLGDRFRRERFLLAITLFQFAALVGSAAAAFAREKVLVFAFAGLVGLASTLFRPALQALLPSLARTCEELIASNGATSTIESLGTLFGPLAAGALISFANVGFVFLASAAALLIAASLLARIQVEGRIYLVASTPSETPRDMVLGGFRTLAHAPRPRLIVGLIVAQCFVRGCLNVLIVVAAFRILHAGAGAVGYITAAIGVGGFLGAVGAMGLGGRRLAVPFGLALVFWGLPIALIAPRPYFAVAVILLAVVGSANSVEDVAAFTLLQRIVPDALLTRVLGVVWGLAMGGVAVGSITAPALVTAIGARPAFAVVGSLLPLLTLLSYTRLVEIDRSAAPAVESDLVDDVDVFAPLSLAAKERLATKLSPLSVAAGEVVIRAGDIGDRFYIVSDGELAIDADGLRTNARRGEYVGEIALLRDIPRTATVTAAVDSELFALAREDFLAVVTGHATVRRVAEAIADARLVQSTP